MLGKRHFHKFLINPAFQLRFIGWGIAIAFLILFVFYSSNMVFFKYYLNQGLEFGLPPNHIFFNFLKDQYVRMNYIFLLTSIIAVLVIFVSGVVISHRISGPLYHLRVHLDKIRDGASPSAVQFRSTDYFQEIAVAYNEHLSAILGPNLNAHNSGAQNSSALNPKNKTE